MIILYTDFSLLGPFVGQIKSVIYQYKLDSKVIDLMHDAPMFNIKHSACLLNSLTPYFPTGDVFCCVVDPGVGSTRNSIVVKADDKFYIGPDNGLFEYIIRSANKLQYFNIIWKPEVLSATFHGRDIYAPIAAQIDSGNFDGLEIIDPDAVTRFDWPNDLYEIIYIDHYGNAITGVDAVSMNKTNIIKIGEIELHHARTFSDVSEGRMFWHENSIGLEIGRAHV